MFAARKEIDVSERDADPADEFRRRAEGTNVNEDTLLATDYLNHFNEVVMLIDLLPSMPDVSADIRAWQPKGYVSHFEASGLRDGALAIAAYPYALESARAGLEETVEEINKVIVAGRSELQFNLELEDDAGVEHLCAELSRYLRHLIDVAASHINGTLPAAGDETAAADDPDPDDIQAAIDALME